MRKVLTLSVVLLALGALVAAPGVAADVDANAEAQIDLVQEEPLVTPAEAPEIQDILDPSQGLQADKIEACSGPHPECPPGCECAAITVNKVYCSCP